MQHDPPQPHEPRQSEGESAAASEQPAATETITERSEARSREDDQFVPVIVKRTDEARRHPDDTLERAVGDGLEQIRRPFFSLALSALAAGLIVGFSAMAAAIVADTATLCGLPELSRLAVAIVYPLGFVMCVLSGTQLFTEHTATAVYPVLDGRASVGRLVRLWGIVVAGNLVGGACMAGMLTLAEPVVAAAEGYRELAIHASTTNTRALLVSTILAGWLMAQGAWLVLSTNSTSGQILSIYAVTFLIGLGRLHHSIAGTVEVLAGYLIANALTLPAAGQFVGLALLGNLAGGSIFVAALNYTHIRGTQAKLRSGNSRGRE